jgi:CheY-like chemotaxis protein
MDQEEEHYPKREFYDVVLPVEFIPRRILLVEDGRVNQKVASRLLEKRGHEVTVANNGMEAVSLHKDRLFDVILMDVEMPVMDGIEATASIRENERDGERRTPIIAVTAHAGKEDRVLCIESGMDGYISKPYRPRELFEAVEAVEPGKVMQPGGVEPDPPAKKVGGDPAANRLDAHAAFDYALALDRAGNSEEILSDLVSMFREEYPKLMHEISEAKECGDGRRLELAAHALKGAASLLAATPLTPAAREMEKMGKAGDFSGSDSAWNTLQKEIERLNIALDEPGGGT